MNCDECVEILTRDGLKLKSRGRLPNETGEQARFDTGEIVNVFDNGTLLVQGKNQGRVKELLGVVEGTVGAKSQEDGRSRNMFVVYGHDMTARTQLEAMLRRWKLEPLILDQLPSEGQTVIEKLMKYAADDVGFGIVLVTPDDEGNEVGHEDQKQFRARQNVVLELGLLLGKLGRERVAVLIKGQERMERPSDIQGLVYVPFTDDVEETKVQLAKEIQKQGIQINIERL